MKRILLSSIIIISSALSCLSWGQSINQISQIIGNCIKATKHSYEVFAEMTNRAHPFILCCDGLPSTFDADNKAFYDSLGMQTLSWHNLTKFQNELEHGIDVMEVYYKLEGNSIVVYIKLLTVTKEEDKILHAYWFEDIDKYVYKYSCESNEWELVSSQ